MIGNIFATSLINKKPLNNKIIFKDFISLACVLLRWSYVPVSHPLDHPLTYSLDPIFGSVSLASTLSSPSTAADQIEQFFPPFFHSWPSPPPLADAH